MGHQQSMTAPTSKLRTDVEWQISGSRVQISGGYEADGLRDGTSPEAESRPLVGGGWNIRIYQHMPHPLGQRFLKQPCHNHFSSGETGTGRTSSGTFQNVFVIIVS